MSDDEMSDDTIDSNNKRLLGEFVTGLIQEDGYPIYKPDFIKLVVDMYKDEVRGTPVELKLPNDNYFVIGDIHGDYYSLLYILRIISECRKIKPTKVIFLGDYVDRGPYGIKVLVTLMTLKVVYPDDFYLLRGNHEERSLNEYGTFKDECINEFGEDDGENMFELFCDVYDFLPISCIISDRFYCVHGGVPLNVISFNNEIKGTLPFYINEDSTPNIVCALWDDPMDDDQYPNNTYEKSNRGDDIYYFGQRATKYFMEMKNVKMIVRAHEVLMKPLKVTPDFNVLTVFSSINYWKFCKCSKNYANFFYVNSEPEIIDGKSKSCTCYALFEIVDNIKGLLKKNSKRKENKTVFQFIDSLIKDINNEIMNPSSVVKEDANQMVDMQHDSDINMEGQMEIETTTTDKITKRNK